MSRQLLMIAGALGVVFMLGGESAAQVITVNANHKVGPPPTASPGGSYSLMPTKSDWQVQIEYGTFDNGKFKAWKASPTTPLKVFGNPNIGVTGKWGPAGPDDLTGAPAQLKVRVYLQEKVGGVWATKTYNDADCPPPP
ncbi:MAG: hypothetical protein K2X87_15525 [Gemmataceae bacterium]|nr:hypothetical protein [Gemmataceae bacterium]